MKSLVTTIEDLKSLKKGDLILTTNGVVVFCEIDNNLVWYNKNGGKFYTSPSSVVKLSYTEEEKRAVYDELELEYHEEIQAEESKKPDDKLVFRLDPIFNPSGIPSFTRITHAPDEDECAAIDEIKIGCLSFYVLKDFDGTIFLESKP